MADNHHWGMIGHTWAVNLLAGRIADQRSSHATLITGADGIGKHTLAFKLAQSMQCTGLISPCGECRACDHMTRGLHPDLVHLETDGASIKIESVRDLQGVLNLRPTEARFRIALIGNAERLTPSAADALLKTLEEPPSTARLILTASSTEALPVTIVSRCQNIPLRPVPIAEIERALIERGAATEHAQMLAAISRGLPGRALAALGNPGALAQRNDILDGIEASLAANRIERLRIAEALSSKDTDLSAVLEEWQAWWRDVLVIASGSDLTPVNIDRIIKLREMAAHIGLSEARRALRVVRETARIISETSVNTRLALDVMLIKMPFVS